MLVVGKLAIARIAPDAPLEAVKVRWWLRYVSGPAVRGRRRGLSEADHGKREHGNEHDVAHETVLWPGIGRQDRHRWRICPK